MGDIVAQEQAFTSMDVRQQVNSIQELMRDLMKPNEHYGTIPGTNKPSLLKAGAEKLGFMFRLTPKMQVTRNDLPNGHREYEVMCDVYHMGSGTYVGQGVGTCSTMESKYRYRHEGGFEVQDAPIPENYREKKEQYRKKGFGAKRIDGEWKWVKYTKSEKVENPDIADVYNTVLKMAKKRAYIDAILTATAASDIFTQDIDEDYSTTPPQNGNGHEPEQPSEDPKENPFEKRKTELVNKLNQYERDGKITIEQLRQAADYVKAAPNRNALEEAWKRLETSINGTQEEAKEEAPAEDPAEQNVEDTADEQPEMFEDDIPGDVF